MKNIAIVLGLLIDLSGRINQLSSLLKKAQDEGRDITEDELTALVAEDDAARANLDDAIEKAKAEGR